MPLPPGCIVWPVNSDDDPYMQHHNHYCHGYEYYNAYYVVESAYHTDNEVDDAAKRSSVCACFFEVCGMQNDNART